MKQIEMNIVGIESKLGDEVCYVKIGTDYHAGWGLPNRRNTMKSQQEKFHSALDQALAIVIAKREAGYPDEFSTFACNAAEQAISSVYTVEEFLALPGNMKVLIAGILRESGKTQECGVINSIILNS